MTNKILNQVIATTEMVTEVGLTSKVTVKYVTDNNAPMSINYNYKYKNTDTTPFSFSRYTKILETKPDYVIYVNNKALEDFQKFFRICCGKESVYDATLLLYKAMHRYIYLYQSQLFIGYTIDRFAIGKNEMDLYAIDDIYQYIVTTSSGKQKILAKFMAIMAQREKQIIVVNQFLDASEKKALKAVRKAYHTTVLADFCEGFAEGFIKGFNKGFNYSFGKITKKRPSKEKIKKALDAFE